MPPTTHRVSVEIATIARVVTNWPKIVNILIVSYTLEASAKHVTFAIFNTRKQLKS